MADTVKSTMRQAEKLVVKIKKAIKRNDLDYTIQVSISSNDPGTVYYATQITPAAEGLAPMTFIDKSPEGLLEKIEKQVENINPVVVERAYHESQIKHANITIKHHEREIERIDEESKEEEE